MKYKRSRFAGNLIDNNFIEFTFLPLTKVKYKQTLEYITLIGKNKKLFKIETSFKE
jgi:hypothetical protein